MSVQYVRVRATWHIRRPVLNPRHPNRVSVYGGCMSSKTTQPIRYAFDTLPEGARICAVCQKRFEEAQK